MYTHTIQVPEAEAASLFAQILGAVAHCHSNNVVHRDLKLDNIMLDYVDGPLSLPQVSFVCVLQCELQCVAVC